MAEQMTHSEINIELANWVEEQTVKADTFFWENVHPLSRRAAHFWLSRFVAEIERKAYAKARANGYTHDEEIERGQSFDDVKVLFGLGGVE